MLISGFQGLKHGWEQYEGVSLGDYTYIMDRLASHECRKMRNKYVIHSRHTQRGG